MGRKYAIGVDYGTESGRALLVDVATGDEIATAVYEYGDGVIDEVLPGTEIRLPPDFALQNPADYIETLRVTIPAVLEQAGVSAADVIGVGTDFTACTMLPIDEQGTPLCLKPEWRDNPYAWVKLWKHHAAQPEANRLNEIARQRGEEFLSRYGGKISSEWLIPKIWETLNKAPEVYAAADRFIEAADWIVLQLCGQERRNSCTAGYKGIWEKATGYPSDDFYAALDPRLRHVADEKLSRDIYPLGGRAGGLTRPMAQLTGLLVGATLATRAEEIYRALIESTAFGTRLIMETFQNSGVPVREVVACGGLPERNKLLMQIYVDVTGREFKIARSKLAGALGAAMFGAVAAGQAAGGYDTIFDAAQRMAHLKDEVYRPIPENQCAYDRLYAEYVKLHDTFGRENPVMKTLKRIRAEALGLEGAA